MILEVSVIAYFEVLILILLILALAIIRVGVDLRY